MVGKIMNVGDLVKKIQGYGSHCNWVGLVVGQVITEDGTQTKLIVLTDDGIDHWISKFCKIINA